MVCETRKLKSIFPARGSAGDACRAEESLLVTSDKSIIELPSPYKGKNRRSDRYPVIVPVKIKWSEANGAAVIEFADAKEVNMHGGRLEMKGRRACFRCAFPKGTTRLASPSSCSRPAPLFGA
jgi:hypothetical protein